MGNRNPLVRVSYLGPSDVLFDLQACSPVRDTGTPSAWGLADG